jgi:glucosamine--fructose-6-phosphate aminotransferase (isomerizing)
VSDNTPGEYTYKEIMSQPETWRASLKTLPSLSQKVRFLPSGSHTVIFTGCGSTYYLSLWAARLGERIGEGIAARAAPASDLFLFPSSWFSGKASQTLVAISRSAQTSETLRAIDDFHKTAKGESIGITCYPDRELGKKTSYLISTPDAQEESIAQTRSFTNMMLAVLWWLEGGVPANILPTLPSSGEAILNEYGSLLQDLARDTQLQRFFFLGGGPLYGLACEAMLKMKEMSLSYAEAYHFLEFRHGPKSMVDNGSIVIGLMSDEAEAYELDVLHEMRALGAQTVLITEQASKEARRSVNEVIEFASGLPFPWRSPLYLPLLQLLAYSRALEKDLDPDRPANLEAVVVIDT